MTTITAELTSGTQVTISNGRHTWRADEPTSAGGNDTGPTPYELITGSLAACTLVTLALYCRHKQIPLKSITATYEHGNQCQDSHPYQVLFHVYPPSSGDDAPTRVFLVP